MERLKLRTRLQQLHDFLSNSRYALEKVNGTVRNKSVNDLLFTMACRRLIMVNMLDRELGTLAVPNKKGPEAEVFFKRYVAGPEDRSETDVAAGCMTVCEHEEDLLRGGLEEMMFEPGLSGRTRQMISELIDQVRENLADLRFIKGNLSALRA
ncbi:MAG: hypothetical protein KA230_11930 [Flavobacteriales bacterium]|nr:hypothetical protein [Flavobacteriales bacterium]MBP6575151.1 hypothetical protein [Flavobacteriales bacterium]